jgi:gliding motility-associated-like protein
LLNSIYLKIFQVYFRFKTVFLLFLIFVPAILTAQKAINSPQTQQLLDKSNKNRFFIENKGQWPKQVKFLARLGGMNCWITDSGVVYDYYQITGNFKQEETLNLLPHEKDEFERTHTSYKGHVVRMDYAGINLNAEKQGFDKREAYYNYFIGNDSTKWASFVGLYGEVLVKDAYKGIDIRYYFDSGQIRYDYLVNAGVDISQINFKLTGAKDVAVNENGELIIQTNLGEVKHGKLYAYQQTGNMKKEVSCRFEKKEDGNFGVIASDYEKGLALVIDPLIWSTFLGGAAANDVVFALCFDSYRNVYLTGIVNSSNFPTTTGSYDNTANGYSDIFITKLNSNASSLIYSTFIGGWNGDWSSSIVIDSIGESFITGNTGSNDFPVTSGSYDQKYNDIYILKLNSSGSGLVFSTFIGGSSTNEYAVDILIDNVCNIYITGVTESYDFPTTSGAYKQTAIGIEDCFITKLNSTGTALIYSTYIGGDYYDIANGSVLDKNNNIYITGKTLSANYPTTTGTYNQTINGGLDCFITKLNSTGSALIFSTFIGGNNSEEARTIALDTSENIYISGYTSDTNYPTTSGAFNRSFNNIFVSKLNSSASKLIASTFLGGNSPDDAIFMTIDIDENIYLTGITYSINYPVTPDAINKSYSGAGDAFITKLNPDLSLLIYSSYLGGKSLDQGLYITTDSNRDVYIAGYTESADFPTTSGVYDQIYNGNGDAYISKLAIFKQANSISCQNINCTQMGIHWKNGDGTKRIVFIKQGDNGYPIPVTKTVYTSNTVFGLGSQIDNSGWYCIYNDTGSSVTISGLNLNTIYRIMVLEVADSNGIEKYVIYPALNNPVNQISGKPPIASFSISDTIQCQKGNSFFFINNSTTSSGTISNVWWFGDGDTSTQQNPQHSYSSSKSFNVKLVVTTGANCSDSVTKMVVVLLSPTASFSINDSIQCLAGNNFVFTNNSTNSGANITSSWQFGDGNNSLIPDPSHSYTYTGTFPVKLVVVSDTGCKDSVIQNAIVGAAPIASFIAYDSSQCLERNNFLFSNKSASANGSFNCNWNFGDTITSTLLNPMHKYSYADTFTVVLIVTDTIGCKDTFSKHTWVHVHPEPLANFSVNDSSQCLNGNVFALLNNSTIKSGTFSQTWDFADGYNTVSYNANHSYSLADSYMIKLLIVSDWACKDSILRKVYVRPEPKASFTINLNPQYKSGNKFIFTSNSVISSGNLQYFWDFGDGNSDISVNPIHSYSNSGTYYVKLIVSSDYGCADTFYDSAIVLKFTKINLSFTSLNGCVGIPVNFKNASTVAPPDSFINFLWDFGDGNQTIILDDPQHIYTSPGSYIITFIGLTAFGNKDTLTDTIEIYPSPTVVITAVPDTISIPGRPVTLTASGLYDLLLWSDNSTGSSITANMEGKFWVTAAYNNGCKSSDTIELTKGENKQIDVMNVITPNGDGINDKLVIKNIDRIQPCKFAIYNRWGDEIYSTDNYQNNWVGTYNGKALPEGTYYFVVVAKDGKVYKGAVNILK